MLVGPLVAVLGLTALVFAVRTRWHVQHSLYESLRVERRQQVEAARERALNVTPAPAPMATPAPAHAEIAGETVFQRVAGQAALVAALLVILLGVLLLLAAGR